MVQSNCRQREFGLKIVYCGPKAAGKRSNLLYIYKNIPQHLRSDLMGTGDKESLFFDFLPQVVDIQTGMKLQLRLCVAPYKSGSLENLILRDVDAVIFVVDSQSHRMEENRQTLHHLEKILSSQNQALSELPFIIQWNKADLSSIRSRAELEKNINIFGVPGYEAVACIGEGVFATLKQCLILSMKEKFGGKYCPELSFLEQIIPGHSKLPKTKKNYRLSRQQTRREIVSKKTLQKSNRLPGGIGHFFYTEGMDQKNIQTVRRNIEQAIKNMPAVFIEYIVFQFSLAGTTFKIILTYKILDNAFRIEKYRNNLELLLNYSLTDTIRMQNVLAETFIAYLVKDYKKLKDLCPYDENAYFKLELMTNLINYRNYYRRHYHYSEKKPKKRYLSRSQKSFIESWFLVMESRSLLFRSGHGISFLHIFRQIMEDKNPQGIVLTYLHIYLRSFLARKGVKESPLVKQCAIAMDSISERNHLLLQDILYRQTKDYQKTKKIISPIRQEGIPFTDLPAMKKILDNQIIRALEQEIEQIDRLREQLEQEIMAMIKTIAILDVSSKLSVAQIRNVFKEFGSKRMEKFSFFHATPYWQKMWAKLSTCNNNKEFRTMLGELFSPILGNDYMRDYLATLSDIGGFLNSSFVKKQKDAIIRLIIEDMLKDKLGKKVYDIIQRQMAGEKINNEELALVLEKFHAGPDPQDWMHDLFILGPPA